MRLVALLLAALALAGCNDFSLSCGGSCGKQGNPYPLAYMAPGPGWWFAYSVGMPNPMAKDAAGNYTFDFPVFTPPAKNGAGVHYVVAQPSQFGGLAVGKTITMTFKLEGSGTLYPTDPADTNPDAVLRLFIERTGDHMSEEYFRWWSNPVTATVTRAGTFTITVKISPDQWSSVFGKKGDTDATTIAAFKDAVANAANVGFTWGGMFAGHGDAATGGPVRFTLQSFSIQ